jgi:cation diffusion facilitator CzcD-associated flavoprotein CzcO
MTQLGDGKALPDWVRVAVIGAGFSGLGMAHGLLESGIDDFVVLEKAEAVGGTWYHNTYPGCACDVPSRLYSFSWALNPEWTHSFSRQPEIQAYLEGVTDRFGLRNHLHLGCEVTSLEWSADAAEWRLDTTAGLLRAQVVVAGSGPLHDPRLPEVPGLFEFPGKVFHSAQWDGKTPLDGLRVAVVGTGASAVQIVPEIAPRAAHLTVFQRTAAWVTPRGDRRFSDFERRLYRRIPVLNRLARWGVFVAREALVPGFTRYPKLLGGTQWAARRNLAKAILDPELRRALTPSFRIGCKRILLSNDYYPALARPTTTVVPAALASIDGSTLVGADGTRHEVDAIVFATGFHVTDPPIAAHIPVTEGGSLADRWAHGGMRALQGMSFAGVPNFFLLAGPNTGIGHTSLVLVIEAQVASIVEALGYMEGQGADVLSAKVEAQDAYSDDVARRMATTVWQSGGCASWYLDAQGRNTTLWPGSIAAFRSAVRFRPQDYHRRVRRAVSQVGEGR